MPYVVLIVAVSSKKLCAKFKETNQSGEINNSQ